MLDLENRNDLTEKVNCLVKGWMDRGRKWSGVQMSAEQTQEIECQVQGREWEKELQLKLKANLFLLKKHFPMHY